MAYVKRSIATTGWSSDTGNRVYICPDTLRLNDLGAADSARGKLVRGFFWLLRWLP